MKKTVVMSLAFALAAGTAFAGNPSGVAADTMVLPAQEDCEDNNTSDDSRDCGAGLLIGSSGGANLGLAAIVVLGLLAAGGGGSTSGTN